MLLVCGGLVFVSDPTKGQLQPFIKKKIVLKVVLPETFGSTWAAESYRGVKADTTLIFNFSGVALQICFRKREERGEPDSIRKPK